MRNVYKIFVGKSEGRNHLEDLGVDGRTILKWILGKWCEVCGLDSSGSGWGSVKVSCEQDNELARNCPAGNVLIFNKCLGIISNFLH
jgi:hypothetical protein